MHQNRSESRDCWNQYQTSCSIPKRCAKHRGLLLMLTLYTRPTAHSLYFSPHHTARDRCRKRSLTLIKLIRRTRYNFGTYISDSSIFSRVCRTNANNMSHDLEGGSDINSSAQDNKKQVKRSSVRLRLRYTNMICKV